MFVTFIISAILLIVGVLLLGFRVFFIKGGVFPNIHIGGSKAMKERGISCATSQFKAEPRKPKAQTANQIVDDLINNF